MNIQKRDSGTGFFRQLLLLLLFGLCTAPLMAQTGCNEEMGISLVKKNLDMRHRFLKNEKLFEKYESAAAPHTGKIQAYLAAPGAKNWDGICKEVFTSIAIADDVLAGGSGTSEPMKTPWDKCTPERMFSMRAEFDMLCVPGQYVKACENSGVRTVMREVAQLNAQVGRGDLKPARYVNRMCELYTDVLKVIKD